jgi:hypothetical protein
VLFNWRHRTVDGGDANSTINMINNYYKPGPATPDGPVRHRIVQPSQSWSKTNPVARWGKVYAAGNVVADDPAVTADNWDGGVQFELSPDHLDDGSIAKGAVQGSDKIKELIGKVKVDKPLPMPWMPIQSAQEAYDAVLAGAGATLPVRDAVDQRVITEVKTGVVWAQGQVIPTPPMKGLAKNNIGVAGNGIITDISQVGGYPDYKGTPYVYSQNGGIPDWWKTKYGLDVHDADLAGKDCNGDGYTNIEKYLNGLDPTKKIDWKDPKNNVDKLGDGAALKS